MPEHGGLIAGAPVGREHKAVPASDIGDAAVAQIPQIVCRLLPRQHIVIIDVNGLVGELVSLPDEDKEQAFPVEIVNDGILLPGIEDDKAVRLPAAGHGADGLKDFPVISAGDDGVDVLALVAELADAPDDLQIEGVFKGLLF